MKYVKDDNEYNITIKNNCGHHTMNKGNNYGVCGCNHTNYLNYNDK